MGSMDGEKEEGSHMSQPHCCSLVIKILLLVNCSLI